VERRAALEGLDLFLVCLRRGLDPDKVYRAPHCGQSKVSSCACAIALLQFHDRFISLGQEKAPASLPGLRRS